MSIFLGNMLKFSKRNFLVVFFLFFLFNLIALIASMLIASTVVDVFFIVGQKVIPFVLEFLCVYSVLIILAFFDGKLVKYVSLFVVVLSLLIYNVQLNSIWLYSAFLPVEALLNIEYIGFIITGKLVAIQLVFSLILCVFVWYYLKCYSNRDSKLISKRVLGAFLGLLSLLLLFQAPRLFVDTTFLSFSKPPLYSFFETFGLYTNLIPEENIELGALNKGMILQCNEHVDFESAYPLVKPYFYKTPAPLKDGVTIGKPHVIVFFAESLSARNISVYNKKLMGICPNLQLFADSSTVVYNYYNQGAATYRGIQGQLCSMYANIGNNEDGWNTYDTINSRTLASLHVSSIPYFLRKQGYYCTFFGAEHDDVGGLDELTKNLIGFDTVICRTRILEALGNQPAKGYRGSLSDHEVIQCLINDLENNKTTQPLFYSVYTLATHAWLDSYSDTLQYGDGKNSIYNTVRCFDAAFSNLVKYINASSYYRNNTIIIVTADHCFPPLQEFVPMAGDDYAPYFVDKIPLIIHSPFHKLPKNIDNGVRTSIDFAPTLFSLLHYPNENNSFIGRSLFDFDNDVKNHAIAAIGDDLYLIDKQGIHHDAKTNEEQLLFTQYREYFKFLKYVESKNIYWPAKK